MGIGQLRKRLYFERKKRTDDGGGGASIKWVPAWSCSGSISPERGREALAAGRLESGSTATIRIRSSAAARVVDSSYRVRDGSAADADIYNVRSVINPDQRNRYLEILAEKGVGENG